MHDSTKKAVQFFAEHLRQRGVEVKIRNLSEKPESLLIETGEMIADLVDAAAVVFAFPTILGGPHPAIVYAAVTANAMMPKTKFMGMLCSYGWATKAAEVMNSITPNFKATRLDPLLFKGLPLQEDFDRIEKYANDIADAVLMQG
jgi:flavorubredoxin